jgi:gluconolactonase
MHEIRVLASGLRYPEGPVAMPDGTVMVVEIAGQRISRISPSGVVSVVAETGGGPNGLAVGPDGALYVCNNGGLKFRDEGSLLRSIHVLPEDYKTGSIQRVDLASGTVTTLYSHCGEVPLSAPNDLVFDRQGGFYFTDFGKIRGRSRDLGSVYYAEADGSLIVEVIHPILDPNGIGLSPDEQTLYVAETETSRLWAFAIARPGVVAKQANTAAHGGRLVCGLPGYQRFDSLAVEAGGNICIGTLVLGQITVVSPHGELIRTIKCPDPHTTNICFGGPNLQKAYITQSMTGQLIEMDWPEPGLRLNFSA